MFAIAIELSYLLKLLYNVRASAVTFAVTIKLIQLYQKSFRVVFRFLAYNYL